MKTIVNIDGMCCEHCAKRVQDKLSTVNVKLKKKIAVIRSREQLSEEEIKSLVTDAGYTVLSIEHK